MGILLNPMGDPPDQQVAAEPGRRRRAVQPALLVPKIGGRQRFECDDPGFDIGPFRPAAGCEILMAGKPASFLASLLVLENRCHAPASAMR